jgi:4-hydroxy-tetrahydrodipicolinate synthase
MAELVKGVHCAIATPLTADCSPDLVRLLTHARNLLERGCTGLAPLGTTGEANSFSIAERRSILESLVSAGISPQKLMPGTGLAAIPDTVELTKHALSLGVTGVVMLPPFYYKQPSDEGLYAAYASIIEKVADPSLRIVLYHFPAMSAVPLSLKLIGKLRAAYPETIAGIKDSGGDLANMISMVKLFPGFTVYSGADPLMKPLLEAGGSGCITAAANIIAPELAAVFSGKGDVDAAQRRISHVRAAVAKFGQIPAIKALVARRYNDPDWKRVRPPLVQLTEDQSAELYRLIDS